LGTTSGRASCQQTLLHFQLRLPEREDDLVMEEDVEPISPATPLVALKAVAVDTETTGLNPKTARIVQLAAIPLTGATPTGSTVAELINPGCPIPPAITAIHHITDAMVAGAPVFADIWPVFAEQLSTRVIIAYQAGYDVAMLKRECALAGISWRDPPRLCVRALSRCVAPAALKDTTLDGLCRWLDIVIQGRHSAPGDAMAAAAIWARLVPMLAHKGVRTLGEAVSAAAAMDGGGHAPDSIFASSVAEPDVLAPGGAGPAFRLDSYPYRRRVGDVMSKPPIFAPSDLPLREAARLLTQKRISSVLVTKPDGAAGIVTERDLLRGLARGGNADALPIGELASHPLLTIPASMHHYKAVGRMNRLGIRHLAVTDMSGAIIGVVTPRDLLRERATEAIILGDEIEAAADGPALAEARAKLVPLAASLLDDDMDARGICAVISAELCALTKRAAELAESQMTADGKGAAPVPYAVLVLGSGGRGESLLAPDQDNAIIYEHGEADGPADQWFAELGARIADILDVAGVPYCKGGVMARNPEWRKSVAGWRATVDGWVRRSRPEDLLNIDIFFDGVPVHGNAGMGEDIWKHAYRQGHSSVIFQKLLAELAGRWRSPLGLFGGFRVDRGARTDFKIGGLMPIFTGARVLSIKHGVLARSTPGRLRGVSDAGAFNREAAETVLAAHETILKAILRQQLADARSGIPPSNLVETGRLDQVTRAGLRNAAKDVSLLVDEISEALL
jgi:CBS domain-containing protein